MGYAKDTADSQMIVRFPLSQFSTQVFSMVRLLSTNKHCIISAVNQYDQLGVTGAYTKRSEVGPCSTITVVSKGTVISIKSVIIMFNPLYFVSFCSKTIMLLLSQPHTIIKNNFLQKE